MSEKKTKGRKGNGHPGKERSKGTGTLERRGKVYIARWTVDGKRFARSTGTDVKSEAEAKLEEFTAVYRLRNNKERLEAIQGKLDGTNTRLKELEESRPALKLADAWAAFVNSPSRPDTACEKRLQSCETRFNRFVDFMRERFPDADEVRKVTKEHALTYTAESFNTVGNATRNQTISHFCMVWRILMEDGTARIETNPWTGIKKRREVHTRRRELTAEELCKVCANLHGEMRILFAVGIYTGLRLGDCALLDWGEVDLVKRVISLVPRKTRRKCGRRVIIPIFPRLYSMLTETPANLRSGYVMPECAATYIRESAKLSENVKHVFEDAGINTQTDGEDGTRKRALVSFHSFRHTFVSMCANRGVPLAVVQAIVGHSTVDMTQHYYHESNAALISAVGALPDVFGGALADGSGTVGGERSAAVRTVFGMIDGMTEAERLDVLRYLQAATAAAAAVDVAEVPALPVQVPGEIAGNVPGSVAAA